MSIKFLFLSIGIHLSFSLFFLDPRTPLVPKNNFTPIHLVKKKSQPPKNGKKTLHVPELVNIVYPPEAVENKFEGSVSLFVSTNDEGKIQHLKITQSSGYAILDQAALKSFQEHKFKNKIKEIFVVDYKMKHFDP